jgi:hypothetical protein
MKTTFIIVNENPERRINYNREINLQKGDIVFMEYYNIENPDTYEIIDIGFDLGSFERFYWLEKDSD